MLLIHSLSKSSAINVERKYCYNSAVFISAASLIQVRVIFCHCKIIFSFYPFLTEIRIAQQTRPAKIFPAGISGIYQTSP